MTLLDQLQQTIGDAYTLERELGGGGMSRVFLAEERALGRKVVFKVLPDTMGMQVSLERFKREILLAAKLQHPHIVPLLSAGESLGLPYFTMPFVEGESLRARLARHGELPVSDAVRVLREVATALAYAHERGIVHRDIKPDNVLLSGDSAMVTDFGVAKALSTSSNAEHAGMTSLGVALGTPAYMSPEQASADPAVDHRADIYSFGVLAYEMLTGQPPFTGRAPQNLLAAHVTETPEYISRRRATLPPALCALVMRCLEKRAADRPQRAAEIVQALDDITTPSGGMEPASARVQNVAPHSMSSAGGRSPRALIAVLVVVVLGAAGFALRNAFSRVNATPGLESVNALAVLPFTNAGDTANAYFADGMTDALNSALTRIPGKRVIPHSSAAAFRGRAAVEAGEKLGVDAVVEGTVRRDGNRVRITATLVMVSDGSQLWSNRYDADAKDAFAVQDSISSAIVDALRITLSNAALSKIAAHGTGNPEAHDLVLRGRYLADQYTEPALRQAVSLFEQAIAADSTYADAWTGLADAVGRLTDDWDAPSTNRETRIRSSTTAVRLDPASARAHGALATELYWYDRDIARAEREFIVALTLDSSDVNAGVWYPYLLLTLGKKDSAVAVARRTLRLNPYSITALTRAAYTIAVGGFFPEARGLCQRWAELPARRREECELLTNNATGRYGEALAAARSLPPPAPGADQAVFAGLLARAGETEAARRALATVLEYARTHYVREETIAEAYLALGDKERTYEWLDRLYASRGASLMVLNFEPALKEIRDEPRFQALLQRVGIPYRAHQ